MKLFVALALASVIPAHASLTDKVSAGNQMTPHEFGEVIHQVQLAGFQKLLDSAKTKLGVSTEAELGEIVRMCESFSDDSTLGHFVPYAVGHMVQRSEPVDMDLSKSSRNTRAFLDQPERLSYKITAYPGYYVLEIEKKPTICLKSNLNLAQATGTLVHELTHWVGYQPHEDLQVTNYPSHREFVNYMLARQGGEVDATRNEMSAMTTLQIKEEKSDLTGVDLNNKQAVAKAIYPRYESYYSSVFGNLVVGKINLINQELNFSLLVMSNLESRSVKTPDQEKYLDTIALHQNELRKATDQLKREYSGYISR